MTAYSILTPGPPAATIAMLLIRLMIPSTNMRTWESHMALTPDLTSGSTSVMSQWITLRSGGQLKSSQLILEPPEGVMEFLTLDTDFCRAAFATIFIKYYILICDMRQHIVLTEERINKQHGDQSAINLAEFQQNLQVKITSQSADRIDFKIDHIEAPMANALRRIMIAEIPTMAIHKVWVMQNTSIIPDEILSHRLGLIPIKADPRRFIFKKEQDDYNERNSIKFELKIKCEKRPEYKDKEIKFEEIQEHPDKYLLNTTVYASDLKWIPQGSQLDQFQRIQAVHPNIIVAKLRENQEIHIEVQCEKGIGRQHAKWSPVSTAWYKLEPKITIKKPIKGEEAKKLKALCPTGVFDIEDGKAVVAQSLKCTTCRECVREDNGFQDRVELAKIADSFLFTVESVGIYEAKEIFLEAIEILKSKASQYLHTKH